MKQMPQKQVVRAEHPTVKSIQSSATATNRSGSITITNILGTPSGGVDGMGTLSMMSDCPTRSGSASKMQVPIDPIVAMRDVELHDIQEPGPDRSIDSCSLHPAVMQSASGAIDAEPARAGQSVDSFDSNPKLKRFRAKRLDSAEYVVGLAFLEHVIKVLIENHSIVLTPTDTGDILQYFGDCVVNTRIEHCMNRDVDLDDIGCCGCSEAQKETAIEVIKSVLLNGLNIAESLPDMVQFLGKLGIGF
jgi:hypothetical protein